MSISSVSLIPAPTTSASAGTAPVKPASATAGLRLTARGRRLFGGLAILAVALGFGALAAPPAIAAVSNVSAAAELEQVTVGAGETLWEIAEGAATTRDVRDVLADIKRINGLEGAHVEPGQVLMLPPDR
ncbi:hypothetical protein GCM10011490_26240 [Pseudoclavibacter endophyticus]|nr:LysM peptidoglycan-binding domain-containing protein [Pseudoclavibacter endophyticus]GGA74311.1 hypothetical protein GCM10011490_26240 [Pseudoclavibacter endophyticus]